MENPLTPPEHASHAETAPLQLSGSYWEIVKLTAPLILSSTGLMLMHLIDALFLSWHSEVAIAVVGPASMSGFLAMGFFSGVASYTSTFVAQYMGSRQPQRASSAVWQGLYFALMSGLFIAAAGTLISNPLFRWAGHAPEVVALEAEYFRITCWSAPFALVGAALSGFFSGRGDNRTLMLVQLSGFALNGVLSYGLIFGRWGLPEWGSSGAATAVAVAQASNTIIMFGIFLTPHFRSTFHTWSSRAYDSQLFRRMLYFGSFAGLRFLAEIFAWTIFLFFVGRLSTTEMAITNIVWRVNSLAFMPLFGLATAIITLVGQAQGRQMPERAELVTFRGVVVAEVWMITAAAIFLLFPSEIITLFMKQDVDPAHLATMIEIGTVLLRFVALYCLLDGLNLVFIHALQGAGDTRWTMIASALLHLIFLGALIAMDHFGASLYAFWGVATAFVMVQSLVWLVRFRQGHWRQMRVIEPSGGAAHG
ncbi:MAG TPA: MATE family efflux transporter [Planctomycetota bacterium]|nr:MATE family efflux transporter [Planctomycetota bacterium]